MVGAGAGKARFEAAGVGVGIGIGVVAGVVAIAGIIVGVNGGILVEEADWLWQNIWLLIFSATWAGVLLGLVVGLAMDFLKEQKTRISKRLRLWYRACRDLDLASGAIEKTAGKGMTVLLENAQIRRDGATE